MKNSGYEKFFQQAKKASQKQVKPTKPIKSLKTTKQKNKLMTLSTGIFLSTILFTGTIWFWLDPSLGDHIYRQFEIKFLSEGQAKEEVKNKEEKKSSDEAKKTDPVNAPGEKISSAESQNKTTSNKENSNQDLSYYSKLNEKQQELDLKEKELNELEEELHKQKLEVENRIQHLEKTRDQIAGVLKERMEVDQQKVKTLVELYSNMKPQQAAKVIGTLNEDLAIEVVGQMKKKNAAEIMNLLEPSKAQTITEKFAGYKRR